jgi:hypothetical protein
MGRGRRLECHRQQKVTQPYQSLRLQSGSLTESEEVQPATILERRGVKGRRGDGFQHPLEEHFAVDWHPLDPAGVCWVLLLGC